MNGKYLDDSKAPKALLEETSKTRNEIRERRLTGETGYVPVIIVKVRIRKILKLMRRFELKSIWKMDDLCFLSNFFMTKVFVD